MRTIQNTTRLSRLALFAATIIWGTSFVVVKNAVDEIPPNFLLAFRFGIGTLFLTAVFFKRLRAINWEYAKKGALMGLLLFLAYSFQTVGITDTTPGKNAFLTTSYCILVPFLYWIFQKKRPSGAQFLAALICFAGIGLVSLKGGFSIGFGDAFTIISGLFYAAHMVAVAIFTQDRDPVLYTILQFLFAAVCAWAVGFFTETMPAAVGWGSICGVLYLAVFATGVAMLLQNIGQKYTPASTASIILSLEAVFGVVFSILVYGEQLTLRTLMGFLLIFAAILLAETGFSFLRPKKRGQATSIESQ